MKYAQPKVGQTIPCLESNLSFKSSIVPSVRIRLTHDTWEALPNTDKSGMFVYITEPQVITLNKIRAIRITQVRPQVAFAVGLYDV